MTIASYRRDEIPPPTPEEREHYRALAQRPDSEINCSDIPEVADFDGWMTAEEVKAHRAEKRKQATTV
jgi:hypothetical protein